MTTTRTARPTRKVAARPIDKPIRSRTALNEAIGELDSLIDQNPKEGTAAYDRMELLAVLIGAYEAEHLPQPPAATPQEVVKFMAEQQNVTPGELADLLGGRSRLSDFYKSRRPLSTGQIISLKERLGIPADALISRPARSGKRGSLVGVR
jgi:HTH-type transcriptional regulator / antitoxin HigA